MSTKALVKLFPYDTSKRKEKLKSIRKSFIAWVYKTNVGSKYSKCCWSQQLPTLVTIMVLLAFHMAIFRILL